LSFAGLGMLLAHSWKNVGGSWSALGGSAGTLGAFLAAIGALLATPGDSTKRIEIDVCVVFRENSRFIVSIRHECILEPSWDCLRNVLGRSFRLLGRSSIF